MSYQIPKTNWVAGNVPNSGDFNRIEENTKVLGNLRKAPLATGTATAITVTTGFFELEDGMMFTFTAAANNSGAATTINADGKGGKSLYKPGTTTAPKLVAGRDYTVRYSSGSNCFFIKASAVGTAVAADVLATKTFSTDDDIEITGTLALTGSAVDADVLAGKTYYNTDAKTKRTGTYAAVKSVQRGSFTWASGETVKSISVSSITVANSITKLISDYTMNGGQGCTSVEIVDSTTLRFRRIATNSSQAIIAWEVIEFTDIKSRQSGVKTQTVTDSEESVTISNVNPAKTMILMSMTNSQNDIASSIPGPAMNALCYLYNATTLRFKATYSVSRTYYWQVIEFE